MMLGNIGTKAFAKHKGGLRFDGDNYKVKASGNHRVHNTNTSLIILFIRERRRVWRGQVVVSMCTECANDHVLCTRRP